MKSARAPGMVELATAEGCGSCDGEDATEGEMEAELAAITCQETFARFS